jgi:non-ribosomal peptide synthetase-like protein
MPEATLLHDIFVRAAERHSGRIALEAPPGEAGGERITVSYGALQARAAALAKRVRRHAGADELAVVLLARNDPGLYAAQLGILLAGAAFSCLDPAFPDAHIAEVVATAAVIVTDAGGRERLGRLGVRLPPLLMEDEGGDGAAGGLPPRADEHNLAYVIYTSGTTGKPKGVMIEHRSIVNLVEADRDYFGLTPEARVAQCSSPAYDSSIEETWLALAAGATLVLLDEATVRLGPDLPAWLRRERISVLCPPPTLLRTMGCKQPEHELPDLQLLYVGGEALPQELADRWSRGRWMENGYGPTECTVTSVRTRIVPGVPVSIGHPVRGCTAVVLNDAGEPATPGESGELCLGGACLARGYRNLPELTAERFIEHAAFGRLYRTGDRARQRGDGTIECLGRMDAQIKLRGYRIELEAIEAVLARCPGVRAAACKLQGEAIAAFLVADDALALPTWAALRQAVTAELPAYMAPSRFAQVDALPTTAGGKLDRGRLPEAMLAAGGSTDRNRPRTPAERAAAVAFAAALHRREGVDLRADFFLDLGGDSLSAVECVVRLRAEGWSANVRDLYGARNVVELARRMAPAREAEAAEPAEDREAPPAAATRPAVCTMVQATWLAAEIVAIGAIGYEAMFVVLPWLLARSPLWEGLLLAAAGGAGGMLLYAAVSVLAAAGLKRLLIGRYRPLRTPVWSGYYLRHWIVTHMARNIPWELLQGTSAQAWALRRLGARVGRRVYIHRGVDLARGGWDLLTLGDGATLGQEAALGLADLDAGELQIGAVTIGANATLETRAGMDPGTSLGEGASLGPLSWLRSGEAVPEGEHWEGTPAVARGRAEAAPDTWDDALPAAAHAAATLAGRAGGILASALPLVIVAALLPAPMAAQLADWIYAPRFDAPVLAAVVALAALALIASLGARAVAARWLGRLPRGPVSLWSWSAIRLHAAGRSVEECGRWLAGTLFWPAWLRAAGMRGGRRCEISTILDVLPAALTLGDECFLADGIYLAGPRRHRGALTVHRTWLGARTFIGNHAVIPAGFTWPEDMFIGVATQPDAAQVRTATAWFGQPPMELPRRAALVDRRLSHSPGPWRFATRVFWELARLGLPALPLVLACAWAAGVDGAGGSGAWLAFAVSPALTAAAMLTAALAVVAAKWVLLGRVRPGERHFWSCWCGRWDILYMAWEYWGQPVVGLLEGTLLLNAFLRLTGVRIGRRVALGPGFAQVVDPDMLVFEDGATVNGHMQSHTFEDRLLKMDIIRVAAGATVGDGAIVLYGATIGAGARLEPQAVLMKHDAVPPGESFVGAPARPAQQPALAAAGA